MKSFDLAERFQTPVIMLSDLDIGMNDWVVPRLTWDDSYRPDRGRVLNEEELENIAKYLSLFARRRKFCRCAHDCPELAPKALMSRAAPATTSSAAIQRRPPIIRK